MVEYLQVVPFYTLIAVLLFYFSQMIFCIFIAISVAVVIADWNRYSVTTLLACWLFTALFIVVRHLDGM